MVYSKKKICSQSFVLRGFISSHRQRNKNQWTNRPHSHRNRSSVSPGAELLAEGNIHVYGTLRGRALAGINGSRSARIFCHQLEAELVSIAGQYKIFEDIQEHHDQTPKQLYLDDTRLVIKSL